MFLRQLDLTTASRPSLFDGETLLFVQDGVGLYEGKFKIPNFQNGHAYLTSHRVCYVDNEEPRKYSVAIDLKYVDHTEYYAGFLRSSPKITLTPNASKVSHQPVWTPTSKQRLLNGARIGTVSATTPAIPHTAPIRDVNATWICPICGLSNPVPSNFDPATANEHTVLPLCQACGIKPPLVLVVKATIAAMSNRVEGTLQNGTSTQQDHIPATFKQSRGNDGSEVVSNRCPRCTFKNHPSLTACELCGVTLQVQADRRLQSLGQTIPRNESPGPTLPGSGMTGGSSIDGIKFSFRLGGVQAFQEKLKGALVQRKWLLQSAPPVPKASSSPDPGFTSRAPLSSTSALAAPSSGSPQRVVGIAGLEQRGAELRKNNQTVIGTAFEDLEALMTSAKEVIQMAEQFAMQSTNGNSADLDTRQAISDSASALGLITTKDMLGSGSQAENLYVTELSRDLAEFLTDDRKGILHKEGGIISLVDLWQVFNRTRNGIELVSPSDFQKAANMWDTLHLPIRLRKFKSGLLVVQERNRTDGKTVASILSWLRTPESLDLKAFDGGTPGPEVQNFGKGVTAQETAERFGWSVGVATEELEMAEEMGALCQDQCLDGIRFWENALMRFTVLP